jgi:hypothetical protein
MLLVPCALRVKAADRRPRISPKFGSIRVATGVVDSVDYIQDDPVGSVGMPLNRRDDAVVSELQEFGFLVRRTPRSQRLGAPRDRQARVVKQSIEGKSGSSRNFRVQTNGARNLCCDDRAMNSGRDPINQAKAIQADKRRALRIGKTFSPKDRSESEKPVRGNATLRQDSFGEAEEVGRRSLQRRRGYEAAQPLPSVDQSFVNEDFDCTRYREAAYAKPLGQLRFAVDPVARSLSCEIDPQPVDQLTIKWPI